MIRLKKILLFALVLAIPFANILAQKKGKSKSKTKAKHTIIAKKAKASKKHVGLKRTVKSNSVIKNTQLKTVDPSVLLDSLSPRVVTVTSVFKPSLRNAAKINFTAATPFIDTSKMPLTYNIPSQNLFFSYQPVAIRPIALVIDSTFHWENHHYIKAGMGNFSTPYLEVAAAFGDGKKSLINLKGNYTSSTGNIALQQFEKSGIDALGIFNKNNHELTSRIYFNNSIQYKYGNAGITSFSKDQLLQAFNIVGIDLGVHNKLANDFGVTYHPQLQGNVFFDHRNATENNFILKAPINKAFSKVISFDLNFTADLTSLKTPVVNIANNLFIINPTLQFKTPNFKLSGGIAPSWDNQQLSILPNIIFEEKVKDEKLILEAGWVGYYHKNTYQSLSAINPYIQQPTALLNSKILEEYAGVKGSAGKHFTYNARLSFLQINNQPLFVNDTAIINAQTFDVLYEPSLNAMRIHAEVAYSLQEKLSFMTSANFTTYTHQQLYTKPFGLLPIELTGSIRYKVLKDLQLKSDLFFFDGSNYRTNNLQVQKTPAALDFNAGAEFSIKPKLNLWIQFNNLLNSHYQRWNQYEVLGFNFIGGVVYSF